MGAPGRANRSRQSIDSGHALTNRGGWERLYGYERSGGNGPDEVIKGPADKWRDQADEPDCPAECDSSRRERETRRSTGQVTVRVQQPLHTIAQFSARPHGACGVQNVPLAQRQLGDSGQAGRILTRRGCVACYPVVTGDLAFELQLPTDPPDGGVPSEQRVNQRLTDDGPVVATLDVAVFVNHDTVEVRAADRVDQSRWHGDDRRPQTEHRRRRDAPAQPKLGAASPFSYLLPPRQIPLDIVR